MKVKIVLGIVALLGIGVGTYIYQNRYSFYRYLPAENEDKLQSINFKLCDENGKLFSGRVKSESDLYLNIYSYKDGELNGLNVIYYKDSIKELGHWKEGKQNGLFQMYTEDGILIDSANFKNGERDGLTEQYFSSTGKLRVSANYKEGMLEGEYKVYYPNGTLQGEVIYKNGEMDGEFKEYYENGNLRTIVNYKSGELNGLKEDYYENGNLWTRQEFKDNIPEGIYEIYYEDGTPQLKAKIKEGIVIEEKRFNRDGTLYDEDDDRVIISESVDNNFDDISFSENKEEITITEIDEDEIIRTN